MKRALLVLVAAGCADPEWAAPPPRDGLVEAALAEAPPIERGAALWRQRCKTCHGDTGLGDGFNAGLLASRPPAVAAIVARLPGERLEEAVRRGSRAGGHSPQCPPWLAVLGEAGVKDAAEHLRRLAKER